MIQTAKEIRLVTLSKKDLLTTIGVGFDYNVKSMCFDEFSDTNMLLIELVRGIKN